MGTSFQSRKGNYVQDHEPAHVALQRRFFALAASLPASAQVAGAQNASILPAAASTSAPPDSTLLTEYHFDNAYSNAYFDVCGSLPGSDGCYGGGTLGPLGHVGALIEGNQSVKGSVVTRKIYVVDDNAGGTTVKLYVYQKTDNINGTNDTISTSLVNTISLPLVGGTGVKSYMAADKDFLFIGTSLSQSAVKVAKAGLTFQAIGGFSGPSPIYVSSATANNYGSVTLTFSDSNGQSTGFYSFDPSGNLSEDGGGANYLLSTSTALTTKNLLTTSNSAITNITQSSHKRHINFHKTASAAIPAN
jgi:hypothetical protein